MRVKQDARLVINQRRMNKHSNVNKSVTFGVIDARKILNSKKKIGGQEKGNFSRRLTAASSGNMLKPYTKKANFSNLTRIVPSESLTSISTVPEKRVKLAEDGNILVTARSKFTPTVPRWTPSNVDTVDIEHVGISDVLDMDTLPNAAVGSSNKPQGRIPKTLIEEIIDNSNTMIADQVESNQLNTCVMVSNLQASVTQLDIMELFGDVGAIKRAERIQPNAAVIEFFDPTDAVKACDLYHNRLLDGQPMQCCIQPPSPQRSFISQRGEWLNLGPGPAPAFAGPWAEISPPLYMLAHLKLGGRVQDNSSLQHVRTSSNNSRSVVNPHNVRFTVKLA